MRGALCAWPAHAARAYGVDAGRLSAELVERALPAELPAMHAALARAGVCARALARAWVRCAFVGVLPASSCAAYAVLAPSLGCAGPAAFCLALLAHLQVPARRARGCAAAWPALRAKHVYSPRRRAPAAPANRMRRRALSGWHTLRSSSAVRCSVRRLTSLSSRGGWRLSRAQRRATRPRLRESSSWRSGAQLQGLERRSEAHRTYSF